MLSGGTRNQGSLHRDNLNLSANNLSRHNGVILDPILPERQGVDGQSTPGESRSGSPLMGRLRMKINYSGPAALARPDTSGPSNGPQSYYRSHIQPGEPV